MATIEFNGTGGLMEGDFGTNNINVNLDDVLNFDGSDDKIDTNLNLDSTNSSGDTSITLWFKADSNKAAADQVIASGYAGGDGGRWDIYHRDDNDIRFWHHEKAGGGPQYMIDTAPTTNGNWYHFAVVHDDSADTTSAYLNGALVETATASVTNTLTPNVDLHIGCRPGPELWFDGCIADVKVYDAALDASQVAIAASKINVDPSVIGAGTPDGWYKLTNNSTSNSGSAGGTPAVTGTTRIYDAFSVNVQDNSTTTDGTFTVTQGKLEGKDLSSMTFDGTNDTIRIGDNSAHTAIRMTDNFTLSAWIKPHTSWGSTTERNYFTGGWKSGDSGYLLGCKGDGAGGFRLRHYFDPAGSQSAFGASLTLGVWYNVITTYANGYVYTYINGIQYDAYDHGADTMNYDVTTSEIGIGFDSGNETGSGFSEHFYGNIRDVRLYDYVLSADQSASLYAGTYNVTPLAHWNIDDGSGNTVTNTGTTTGAHDGSSETSFGVKKFFIILCD